MSNLVEEKQHARLSPSAAKRWMTCPKSIQVIEKLAIENKPSKYAAEGTVAHQVHELCVLKRRPASSFKDINITAEGIQFKVNDNMIEAVQQSLDYINRRIKDAESLGYKVQVKVEVRCSLKSLGISGLDGGTSDVILLFWDGPRLISVEVFDYKHGQGVAVEPKNNPQAMCYALGVILLPKIYDQDIPEGITITISQPRASHPDGRIRSWVTTKDHILNWMNDELIPKAKATLESDAKFNPSEDACRFCDYKNQCPALFSKTQEVAMLDFKDEVCTDLQTVDVESLTATQKLNVINHAEMIRAFLTSVENKVKDEIDIGCKDYQGYWKLVRKQSRRKFTEDALDEICSPLLDHLDREDIFEEKARSMTEIEKRLKKAIGNKDAKFIMDEITIKPEGEITIAKHSDKRKEVDPSVINDFTGLED